MSRGKGRHVYCQAHCSACGRHFASTSAFELHRVGTFEPLTRHCESPHDLLSEDEEMRLELRTDDGRCLIYPRADAEREPVSVWGNAGARERARQAFSAEAL